tara:strand:+ start:169 stop:3162 length:2994 start_codon:yes stop_codon:yes gene_type:complete
MKKIECLILSAGKHRTKNSACSLWSFSNGKSILDWQIHTLNLAIVNSSIHVAVGYKFEEVVNKYNSVSFKHVSNWRKLNALGSLLEVEHNLEHSLLTMYGDTVFQYETIRDFNDIKADVVIGIDSQWKSRFKNRPIQDINIAEKIETHNLGTVEYTGLIKFSSKTLKFIHNNKLHLRNKSFLELINFLKISGFEIKFFDVKGCWAEMNETNDLVKFILGTKAETLYRIKSIVKKSIVCEQYLLISKKWQESKKNEILQIQNKFNNQNVIVRSSSSKEDNWKTSNAGAFLTIMDVKVNDRHQLSKAIDQVFNSYKGTEQDSQVLIQPFVKNVILSGVIFTRDLETGSPYYVINYDDISGSTSSITSGADGNFRNIVLSHTNTSVVKNIDNRISKVIEATIELQNIFGFDKLDIEFAIDNKDNIYSFQVRPITVNHDEININDKNIFRLINNAQKNFKSYKNSSNNTLGNYTIFSNMTDWNPAEIIGTHPKPLAFSLYQHIIMNDTWATQRAEFGYRDIRPTNLMYSFCDQPYVDCRASINSFIPNNLTKGLAKKLIDAYLAILKNKPFLHDKLELEVVFTIWEPNFYNIASNRFKGFNISRSDIILLEKELKKITLNAFRRLDSDLIPLKRLEEKTNKIVTSHNNSIEKTFLLIETCKEFGTLPFSHAARAGFVAITLLKRMVNMNVISKETMLKFQSSIKTITSEFTDDLSNLDISLSELTKKYGHLRPGTYDIAEQAYWENKDFYFKRPKNKLKNLSNKLSSNSSSNFSKKEINEIVRILQELDNTLDAKEIFKYFEKAIQSRELAKFNFSRTLSLALDELVKFCSGNSKINRNEINYLNWKDICDLKKNKKDIKQVFSQIKKRKISNQESTLIKLPSIIFSTDDFFGFEVQKTLPNFITQKKISKEVVHVNDQANSSYKEKIVMISSADPGYDWLFAHGISGLITKYGGANSHMAIRCAELGLPAAIGIGEELFSKIKNNSKIILNCSNEKIINA